MSCSLKEKANVKVNVKVKKSKCKLPSLNSEKFLLSEILSCYSKDELIEIRKTLKIKGVSKLSKKDLITFLDEYIATNFDGILENLDFNQYLFLNRYFEEKEYLINNEEVYVSVIQSLKNYGIIFPVIIDSKTNLVIPTDINKLLEDKLINNDKLNIGFSVSRDILKVISEIIYCYGVLEFDELYSILSDATNKLIYNNSQKLEVEFDKKYLSNLLDENNCIYYGIKRQENLILNENVYDENCIVIAHEKLSNIPYNNIECYEDICKSSKKDECMIKELIASLSKDILLSQEKINTIASNSLFFLKNGLNIDYIMENLKSVVNLKNSSIEEELRNKLDNINFRISKWCLKGYNEKEIININNSDKLKTRDFKIKSKVGRNDPCPCGSGKKYKKCCMKMLKSDI